jgi:hypothetical protein
MYFSRTGDFADLILLLLQSFLWACGGYLLTSLVFQVRKRERLLVGLAVGLLLFISISNLVAIWLPVGIAFWLASILIFLLGIVVVVRRRGTAVPYPTLEDAPLVVITAGAFLILLLINRGLGILDDYHNLPLVSTMAAGDIPPHFYLDAGERFAYHYGLHVYSAALVSVGGLFPWSAFDIGKALSIALSLALMVLWLRRVTSREALIAFGTATFAFLAGTRWLLLFAPPGWAKTLSSEITLLGSAASTGESLYYNLSRIWVIEGGGPIAFPFAFISGIMTPLIMRIGGGGALPAMTLLLLLLLFRRAWSRSAILLYAVIFSSLALSSELLFVLAFGGVLIALMVWLLIGKREHWQPPAWKEIGGVLGITGLIALVQGGVITELARGGIGRISGQPVASYGFEGFQFIWPPRIISAHLGSLSVLDMDQLLLGLLEIGPAILLALFTIYWAWPNLRRGNVLLAGLAIASFGTAFGSLFLQYGMERDTARLLGAALLICTIIGLQPAMLVFRGTRRWLKLTTASLLLIGIFGGLVIFGIMLTAVSTPTPSYFLDDLDTRVAQKYWDQTEPESMVFDRDSYRGVALFGRAARSHNSWYASKEEWAQLVSNPSPANIHQAGYDFLYMDQTWWSELTPKQRADFQEGCARQIHEQDGPFGTFRWLFDLTDCP